MKLASLLLALPLVTPARSLESYVDHNRVLLLFAPLPEGPELRKQRELLAQHEAGLRERDVVIVPDLAGPKDAKPTPLRARFRISPGEFTVILLGKDGGEKLRQHTPVPFEQLAATIDAMPMRQEERRRQRTAGFPPK